MANERPIVFVHGLLGFGPRELGPLNYWGSAFKVASPIARHEGSVGPLSSAHDRACELAAQIKGTRVDYGEEHALEAGHERYGRDEFIGKGFVPDWSDREPVHLVGHSLGSPTIRCLQNLLEDDYWGWGSDHRWVASISTVSGVSNGSTLVYHFGADEETGLLREDSRGIEILRLVETFIGATGGIFDTIYDFDLEHWGLVRDPTEPLTDYMKRCSRSGFMLGKDNAAYSLSLQGAFEDNGRWRTFPDTYYFSYITEQTFRGWITGRHYPSPLMNPGMLATASYIGQKAFTGSPIPVADFDSSDWWENDGLVSTWSQKYPHTAGEHPVGGELDDETLVEGVEPGKWYCKWERGVDHLDVCISPQIGQIGRQRRFYKSLYARLAALDLAGVADEAVLV